MDNSNSIVVCHHQGNDIFEPICIPETSVPSHLDSHSQDYCGQCNWCEMELEQAFELLSVQDGPFGGGFEKPEDVIPLCDFDPPDHFVPFLSCPFFYLKEHGFVEETAYDSIFGEASETIRRLFSYCECQHTDILHCEMQIPPTDHISTDDIAANYCTFATVWSGDVGQDALNDLPLSVTECGCYWVWQARHVVHECPGIDLSKAEH